MSDLSNSRSEKMHSLSDLSTSTRSEKYPHWVIWVTQPAPKRYSHWVIWVTQLAAKKYPHWVIWVTQPAPKKNTHSLRFPYTHAYQYKYRIPRKCKTNNKLIKVVQILGKIVEKKKKKNGSIGEMKNKSAILWLYREDQQPPALVRMDLIEEENRHYSGVVEQLDW